MQRTQLSGCEALPHPLSCLLLYPLTCLPWQPLLQGMAWEGVLCDYYGSPADNWGYSERWPVCC